MSEQGATSKGSVADFIDDFYPLNEPLTGRYTKGFAYKTIGFRMPVILTKIIDHLSRDKNEIGEILGQEAKEEVKVVVGSLAKLKNEMITNKGMAKVESSEWNEAISKIAEKYFDGNSDGVRWFYAPWLFVECYFYRRIFESFKATKYLGLYDPFEKQKEESTKGSLSAASHLVEFLEMDRDSGNLLEILLEISLWGNRCDLCLSSGDHVAQEAHLVHQLDDMKSKVLCDDSLQFWCTLSSLISSSSTIGGTSIGYVLDNAGFELLTDLCFADVLLTKVDRIDFYVKTIPWFVSDALEKDFLWLLDYLKNVEGYPSLNQISERWNGFLKEGKWKIISEEFWTYPHGYCDMNVVDASLYHKLSEHTHLIFKGDLNYRKLVNDINWSPEKPFKEALQGFLPTPLLSLRTIKADTVVGLAPFVAEKVEAESPNWLISGEYGIIQHATP